MFQNSIYTCIGLLLFLSTFGITWDYDYMRHWKKKAEMGKTKGLGHVHIYSPGRCPSRVLNGHLCEQTLFQVPAPEYHHKLFLSQPLKSASSSDASFFAQRRARNACDTRVTGDEGQGPFSSSRLPLRARGGFKVIMALMCVYVSRANFTTMASLWTKLFAFAIFVHEYTFQNNCLWNSYMWHL